MSAATSSAQKTGIWLLIAIVLVPSTLLLQGPSGDLYLKIVDLGLTVPKRATEIVMLGIIAAFGLVTWGFRRLEARRILTALAAGIGIVIAYGLSEDRKSTRLNSSHVAISYAVFCLKKKKTKTH